MGAPAKSVNCKLYYNTATSTPSASPTWAEIKKAIDVTWDGDAESADSSSRSSRYKTSEVTQLDFGELTFGYRYVDGGADTVYEALLALVASGDPVQFAMSDQAIATTGACGKKAFCQLKEPTYGEPLNGVREVSFTAVPCYYEESGAQVEPTHFEITGS